jgi:hypothetical protein
VLIWNGCQRFPYAFGGRHVLHAAISSDEGRTWRGYREILRDPRRDEPPPPRGDHGVSYPFAAVTPEGKIVFGLWVSTGEGRDLYRLDPDWLEQTGQRDDFNNGLDGWSTFGTRGVDVIPNPERSGDGVLRVRRMDADWPAAAVWNFPMGVTGSLHARLRIEPEFAGAAIGLTDHFSVPFDEQDTRHTLFNVGLDRQGRLAGSRPLEADRWHDLTLSWDCDQRVCHVQLDGKRVCSVRQSRASDGACYLRLRATADSAVPSGGLEIDFVEVKVSSDHARRADSAGQAPNGGTKTP